MIRPCCKHRWERELRYLLLEAPREPAGQRRITQASRKQPHTVVE